MVLSFVYGRLDFVYYGKGEKVGVKVIVVVVSWFFGSVLYRGKMFFVVVESFYGFV